MKAKVLCAEDKIFHELLDRNREKDSPSTPVLFFIDKELTEEDKNTVAIILNGLVEAIEEGCVK